MWWDVSHHSAWSTVVRESETSSEHAAKGNLIHTPKPSGRDMTQVLQLHPPFPKPHSGCIQLRAVFSYGDHASRHDLLVLGLLLLTVLYHLCGGYSMGK